MSKIDRYKSLVRHIVKSGLASSQKDLGKKMGYSNESAFSQIINEKVPTPKDFIIKLRVIVPDLNIDWLETGVGDMFGRAINQEIVGDNNTSVAGNSNNINSSATMEKAINEISEMRKLIQEQVRNNQEQFDRFMSVIERLTAK